MEAQRIGRRKMYPTRREISLDRRPLCWLGGLPDGERDLAAQTDVENRCAMTFEMSEREKSGSLRLEEGARGGNH